MDWRPDGEFWLRLALTGAGTVAAYLLLRNRNVLHLAGYGLMNVMVSAVVLYLVNTLGLLGDLAIPINVLNAAVIGVLGIPGIALLAAVHGIVLA